MVDRTYSNIDHNVEETEEMRVYRIFQAIMKLHLVYTFHEILYVPQIHVWT